MGAPLPFNFMEVEVATGFDYPEGDYIFEIEKTDERLNQDGQTKRLLIGNKIVMGPYASEEYKDRKLSNSYQLTANGAKFLKRLFVACEIGDDVIRNAGGQLQAEWLVSRRYVASVIKNGQYTNIINERPLTEWDPTKTPAIAPQKAAPASTPPPAIMQPVQPQMPMGQPPVMGAPPMQPAAQQPGMPMQQLGMTMQQPGMAPPPVQQPMAAAPAAAPVMGATAPPMAPPPVQGFAPQPATAVAPPPVQAAVPQPAAPPQQAAAPVGIPAPAPPPGPVSQQ